MRVNQPKSAAGWRDRHAKISPVPNAASRRKWRHFPGHVAAAQQAEEEFNRIFQQKGLPDQIKEFVLPLTNEPIWICKLLQFAELVSSNGEAKRAIQGRAIEVNGQKVEDENLKLDLSVPKMSRPDFPNPKCH